MRKGVAPAIFRVAVFAAVCLLGMFVLFAVFAQLRFQPQHTYQAEFTNVTGLETGNFVRIAGVEVGKVDRIRIERDGTAVVAFSADDSVFLTEGTRALIRYTDLIGGRYLALEQGAGSVAKLLPGGTIPLAQTQPALDLDALVAGFRPLFRALDPQQVNTLTGQLISAFQNQGATIGSFLAQTAALTNTLADRDELIGQVIVNLHVVLGSLGDQSDQFAEAVDSLSELMTRLAERGPDISTGLAYVNAASGSIADLLAQSRPALQNVIHQTDRTAAVVAADSAYFDEVLNTLPDSYQVLARQGLYGDFFSFYLCELMLKINGKGGQPVYIRLANQPSGRCTPK